VPVVALCDARRAAPSPGGEEAFPFTRSGRDTVCNRWHALAMATLLLLRHGQSDWNEKKLFTGWVDVPLSTTGEAEAHRGGELMAEAGLLPDVVHTSLLRRAISTANIALDVCDRHWIPVVGD